MSFIGSSVRRFHLRRFVWLRIYQERRIGGRRGRRVVAGAGDVNRADEKY
jgi:hypothetical protein